MKIVRTTLILIVLWGAGIAHLSAQELSKANEWNFLTNVYLLFPNISGEAGIGNQLTVPIDAHPGDIFSKLKMGGMLYLEARHKRWAITSDLVFMKLNEEVTTGKLFDSGDVTGKQLIWEAAGLYRVAPFLELGVGSRLNYLQMGIDANRNAFPSGTEAVSGIATKTWLDPILITRLTADIREKWLFQFRGDLGGFGVGSDFTWQLQGYAGYRFTKMFQLTAGYRIISIDYDKGVDKERFIFNVDEYGPVVNFGFNF